jgi:hypothetical protein
VHGDDGATGGAHIAVVINTSGGVTLQYGATSGTSYGTASVTLAIGIWYYFELQFKINNTTGSIILYVNGVQVYSFSGDTNRITGLTAVAIGVGPGTVTVLFDDVYVLDSTGSVNTTFLGDCQVQTLSPNGNGTTSQFVGSDADSTDNYLLVDDDTAPDDDTTYVESATSGNKDTYAYEATSSLGTIHGVGVTTLGKKVDAGAADMYAIARSGTTEGDSAALGMSTSYTAQQAIYETNPDTAAAWTAGGIDAAEFGVKVV